MKVDTKRLVVYIPDTRGVTVSPFGAGNLKLGPDVWTYSRLPGREGGTCPGSTAECEEICYAKRVIGPVLDMWAENSKTEDVPNELPPGCKLVRWHVSGDFTSERYINGWIDLALSHPDVTFWGYTRSWRVPELLPHLERLRALPNVQLFASLDKSCQDLPPAGWRRSWIEGDHRIQRRQVGVVPEIHLNLLVFPRIVTSEHNDVAFDGASSYVCPEQTGRKENCEACRYCFEGKRGDVTFLEH